MNIRSPSRGRPQPRHQIRSLPAQLCAARFFFGIARLPEGKRKQNYEAKATDVFSAIFCEPVSALAADHYARIKASQEKLGLPLDENDLWVAAIAVSIDATVVTRDKDIARVPGLRVIDWTV